MAINNQFPGAILHPSPYYGYPTVSASRRIKPTILGVVHTTETEGVPFPSSTKSWTFVVERDGTVHQFLDPVTQTPWTNGDAQGWDTSNPLIVAAASSGYNFNEACFLTIENVNRIWKSERLTDAQLVANRRIMLWGSTLSGLPVERQRVIGHYQINGFSRTNCPTVPSDRDRVFGTILNTTLPDTATEVQVIIRDFVRFEAPRQFQMREKHVTTKANGYEPTSPDPVKSSTFPAGSPGYGIAVVDITGTGGPPDTRYVEVVEPGYFAGLYLPLHSVEGLDMSLPTREVTVPCEAQAELDALNNRIADALPILISTSASLAADRKNIDAVRVALS